MTENKLTTHHIDLPASPEAIAALRPGDVVYLNGVVYTAREGIYERVLGQGQALLWLISPASVTPISIARLRLLLTMRAVTVSAGDSNGFLPVFQMDGAVA